MIDSLHVVDTPEGIELHLRTAGLVARSVAYAVDLGIAAVLLVVSGLSLAVLGATGMGLFLIAAFGIYWFLPVVFELAAQGQTPGKRLIGLRVVERDGTPVGPAASVTRNLLRVVDFLPFFWLTGLLCMGVDRSFRRVGDLAAGTLVVYAEPPPTVAEHVPDVPPLEPPLALEPDEERALIAFAERANLLGPERAQELADIVTPLLGPGDPVDRLLSTAAWVIGRGR